MTYNVWLEFEEYVNPEDNNDGYCNVVVIHDNGHRQGYNVWTGDYFRDNVQFILDRVEEDGFAALPDFIVSSLDRECITAALKKILPSYQS